MIGLVLLLIIFASTLSGHAPFLVAVDGNKLDLPSFTVWQPHGHVP
jgi:hypothetical protein